MKKPGGIVNLIRCPYCEYNSYNEDQVRRHISLTHQEKFINHPSDYWGVVPGGAGGAMERPDFNPISIKGGRLCLPNHTGTPGFSDLPTALDYEDDNAKEVHKFSVINESGTEVFSCSKCGQTFSGFDGQHIKDCWNNESDNGKKTEEYPCESKTYDKRIGQGVAPKKKAFQCDECTKAFSSIGGLNYHKNIVHEEKKSQESYVVTDFEETEEKTKSKTFVKRIGQGVEKCNSELKATEANQEPYVVTDFEESEEETEEESN